MSGLELKNKRIALFGGTFDPFHNGHLAVVHKIHEHTKPDLLLIAPAGKPRLKDMPLEASIEQRLMMTRVAVQDILETEVCEWDAYPDHESYTIVLVEKVLEQYGIDCEVLLVVGFDVLSTLERWYRIKELIQLVRFVAVGRTTKEDLLQSVPSALSDKLRLCHIGCSDVNISASMLKTADSNSELFKANVPVAVQNYVIAQKLYLKQER